MNLQPADKEELDPLVQEILGLADDPDLKEHFSATLPNEGEDLEEICNRGFAQLEGHFDALSATLMDRS